MDLIDSGSYYIYVILIIVVLICSFNISIDGVDVRDTMLPTADNNGFVIVKLKKKVHYKGHVYFESARPNFILL